MMKRCIAIVLCMVLMLSALAACGRANNAETISRYEKIMSENNDRLNDLIEAIHETENSVESAQTNDVPSCYAERYTMNLVLDSENHTVSGDIGMDLKNNTENILDCLCIRNYAATVLKDIGAGESKIENVKVAGSEEPLEMNCSEDPSVLFVSLSGNVLQPGGSVSITFSFDTDIPKTENRFGYHAEGDKLAYQLSFCFPCLAIYENGEWNTNPYLISGAESSYSKAAEYRITFTAPEGYTVVACGNESTKNSITTIEAAGVRDMAIFASNYLKTDSETVNGIRVNNYHFQYSGNDAYENMTMLAAKDSLKLHSEVFGPYAYDELDVVQGFFSSAMEYPGLILIGFPDVNSFEGLDRSVSLTPLCSTVAHEVAHQWFYAAVGNNQYTEPWLDEGFAEYCEDMLYQMSGLESIRKACIYDAKRLGNEGSFWGKQSNAEFDQYMESYIEQVFGKQCIINQAFPEYNGENDAYSRCVYDGGAAFLYELQKVIGEVDFYHMLRKYYSLYFLKEATTSDFLRVVWAYDDSEAVQKIIDKYIRT